MDTNLESRDVRNSATSRTTAACKRCKVKKLKCDGRRNSCTNCHRTGSACLTLDTTTRREYRRNYIDDLEARASYLREYIRNPEEQKQGLRRSSVGREGSSSNAQPVQKDGARLASSHTESSQKFNGEGGVISLGHIVASAVSTKTSNYGILQLGNAVAREQFGVERLKASPAQLPPLPIAQQLLASYLNGHHLLHPFLQRSKLPDQLTRLYNPQQNSRKNPRSQSPEDLFQINMVFAVGAISLTRIGLHQTSPIDYYVTAMEQANQVLRVTGDDQIQHILLILSFALQHDVGIGSKWDLARLAISICVQKEYHKPPRAVVGPMKDQMQRRMFWCAYNLDRHSSSILGRPVAIADRDISVELPMDLDDDAILNGAFQKNSVEGTSEVSLLLQHIRLRKITSKTRLELYSIRSSNSFADNEAAVHRLCAELEEWRASSPIFIFPKNPYETPAWLELNFYRERMSLVRGLAVRPNSNIRAPVTQYLRDCLDAAEHVVSAYQALSTSDKLVMNWTCVHDMLSSGFMVLYCSIYLHQSLILNVNEDVESLWATWEKEQISINNSINGCCEILSHIAGYWKTVENHLSLFQRLSGEVLKLIQTVSTLAASGDGPNAQESSLDNSSVEPPFTMSSTNNMGFGALPAENFGLSDLELSEIFGFGFQDLNFEWDMPSL